MRNAARFETRCGTRPGVTVQGDFAEKLVDNFVEPLMDFAKSNEFPHLLHYFPFFTSSAGPANSIAAWDMDRNAYIRPWTSVSSGNVIID